MVDKQVISARQFRFRGRSSCVAMKMLYQSDGYYFGKNMLGGLYLSGLGRKTFRWHSENYENFTILEGCMGSLLNWIEYYMEGSQTRGEIEIR